jgi:hypothetical protein
MAKFLINYCFQRSDFRSCLGQSDFRCSDISNFLFNVLTLRCSDFRRFFQLCTLGCNFYGCNCFKLFLQPYSFCFIVYGFDCFKIVFCSRPLFFSMFIVLTVSKLFFAVVYFWLQESGNSWRAFVHRHNLVRHWGPPLPGNFYSVNLLTNFFFSLNKLF